MMVKAAVLFIVLVGGAALACSGGTTEKAPAAPVVAVAHGDRKIAVPSAADGAGSPAPPIARPVRGSVATTGLASLSTIQPATVAPIAHVSDVDLVLQRRALVAGLLLAAVAHADRNTIAGRMFEQVFAAAR
jgi:hypothetical protein